MFSLLYVDDEPDLLEIGQLFLESTGEFRVRTVLSGEEALAELGKNTYDVIVSDYQMPGMDGIGLLKNVRRSFGDIPFILFTGRGREEVVIEAINNGADFYLQKGGDPKAQFVELAHQVRQVVTRRRAEHALRESEQSLKASEDYLKRIFEAVQAGIAIIDAATHEILDVNPSAVRMYKGRKEDLVGKPCHTFICPAERGKCPVSDLGQDVDNSERVLLAADGACVSIIKYVVPITLQGRACLLETFIDNTQQKEAEQALHESEKRLADIIDFLPDATFAIDTSGQVIAWNHAIEEMTGIPATEMMGKGDYAYAVPFFGARRPLLADLLLRPDEKTEKMYISIKKSGNALTAESDNAVLNGRPTSLWGKARVLCNEKDEVVGAIESVRDITEQKRTEDELRVANEQLMAAEEELRGQYDELVRSGQLVRQRQQQLEEIAANVPGVIYQFFARPDGSMGLSYVSARSGEIFGVEDTVTDFFPWFVSHVHPDDFSRFMESVAAVVKTSEKWSFEGRFVKPTGETIWFQSMASPVIHGDELIFSGVIFDITPRKESEARLKEAYEQLTATEEELRQQYDKLARSGEALRASEEKYRSLIETTDTGYVIIDDKGKVLDANPKYVVLTGHKDLQEILGRSVLEWTAGYEREKNTEAVQQCFRDGFIRNFEIDYVDAGGNITPVEINATVIHEGGTGRIITLCRDISDRRRIEKNLQESEERYRILTDFAFDGVLIQDFSGRILYVNPSVLRMFGIPDPALVIGKNALDFISPEFRETVIRDMQNVISGTDSYLQTYRAWTPDGKVLWIESIGTKIQYQGEPANIVALRDVTARKQAEEALHRANEKLNLLNSITRHDVANQLTIVLGYTQLAQHSRPHPVITEFLGKIEKAVGMIQRQIEFTRTYQELGVGNPAWFRIQDIVKAAEPQSLAVTCSCGTYEIFADPMLEKVFFNLFDNAVRHGERVTAITVSCETAGEELVITVQDNGIGIPIDVKQKIFEKGYGKNTGFGLFLAREILAITGIFIHETGSHGKGARFEIAVPKGAFRSG